MGLENILQVVRFPVSMEHLCLFALTVQEEERDMTNAVGYGQRMAFGGFDVGHQELQLIVIEAFHGLAGFALQLLAFRALRIVNLDDCRDPVADFREILFSDRCSHFVDQIPAAASSNHRHEAPVSHE